MDLKAIFGELRFDPSTFFTAQTIKAALTLCRDLLIVLASFKLLQIVAARILRDRASDQTRMLVKKAIRYAAFVFVVLGVFDRIGLDLSALLGAAGIAGIAVGFAAQTSISNVISGLFLISEKPFAVGDVVTVGDVTGVVLSVDVLSIKIQTFDNRFVRIPNETIIKSNLVNVTRFPIRRMDIWLTLPYSVDLARASRTLREIARDNVFALDNPEPLVLVDKFDATGVVVLFGPWFESSDFLELKNSLMIDIKKRFEAEGIDFPPPRIALQTDSREGAPRSAVAP
jgi:small-conductance mechanosensitive channel